MESPSSCPGSRGLGGAGGIDQVGLGLGVYQDGQGVIGLVRALDVVDGRAVRPQRLGFVTK